MTALLDFEKTHAIYAMNNFKAPLHVKYQENSSAWSTLHFCKYFPLFGRIPLRLKEKAVYTNTTQRQCFSFIQKVDVVILFFNSV